MKEKKLTGYIAVWLSSYPSEEVMELYINKAKEGNKKDLVLDIPVSLKRYQIHIKLSQLEEKNERR